jgi:hypothetical protein
MKKELLMLLLTLTACHASCGETAESDPVAQPADAASSVPTLQPFNKRSMQRRSPGIRSLTPVEQNQGDD